MAEVTGSSDKYIREIQSSIEDLIRAMKLNWFYSSDHPTSLLLIENLFHKLSPLVEENPLVLNIRKEELLIGSLPLPKKSKSIMDFSKQLNRKRIYCIVFKPGFTILEMTQLIQVLSLNPKSIRQSGGYHQQLSERKVANIDISEYNYQSLASGNEPGDEGNEESPIFGMQEVGLRDIQEFLRGERNKLTEEEENLLMELLDNPMKYSEVMTQALIQKPDSQDEPKRPSEIIREFNMRVGILINQRPVEEKSQLLRKIASSLLYQKPDICMEILSDTTRLNPEEFETVRGLIDEFTDDEILDTILKSRRYDEVSREIETLLDGIPINLERSKKIMVKFNLLSKIKEQEERDETELRKIREYFNSITEEQIYSDAVKISMEIFESHSTTVVLKDCLGLFEKSFPELIRIREFETCLEILHLLDDCLQGKSETPMEVQTQVKEIIPRLASREVISHLILLFENASAQEEENFIWILSYLGSYSPEQIVTEYVTTSRVYFRRPLSRILIQIGEKAVPEILKQVVTCPEEVAKELIEILGNIGSPSVYEGLKTIYGAFSSVFHSQIITVLGSKDIRQNRDWILEQLNSEEDISSQLVCLEALAAQGDKKAIEILIKNATQVFIKSESNRLLQHRSILLLGKLNIQESVPHLIRVLRRGRWIPSKQKNRIWIIVVQTLWMMEDARAKQAVKEGCKDRRMAVRRICQSLVNLSVTETEGREKDGG